MNVLVTGGAGYVGSAAVRRLVQGGQRVVVFDNLVQGHRESLPENVELVCGDICNETDLDRVFASHRFDAIMHFAGETLIEVSMKDPARHFSVNVTGGLNLARAALRSKVTRFIFSSTAAVYGNTSVALISEDHPKQPINAYGESKLLFERMLEWFRRAYGLHYIAFRYFNAAGAISQVGEAHHPETHLIPNVLRGALHASASVTLFGDDYDTHDGTCIRDYIHVDDLAAAHVLALEHVESIQYASCNLGLGRGYSVAEVVHTAKKVTGRDITVEVAARRAGDPPVLVADPTRAKSLLGWKPEFTSLEDIVGSAWEWLREHPNGYPRR